MTRIFILAIAAFIAPSWVVAAPCPGNPQALGTERVIEIDAKSTPRVGRKQFPSTLPLGAKELVLTFDDGPWPGTTPKVLDALKSECVRATFFLLGRNATAHPQLARRALSEGHTVGHHSYSHPILSQMSVAKAEAEIDRGIAADEFALYGTRRTKPATPFFRLPSFAANGPLLARMSERGFVVFGADVWAGDWVPMGPEQELRLILSRLEQVGRGIVLFHDTQSQTAQMLPTFLRELK
ncbi:MAG TPA: polysaccharide deacetylase family protein [Pseudolabrys sp.]|nr:polysaccharide deacetylase family protein [Pseudolabrys sp.]